MFCSGRKSRARITYIYIYLLYIYSYILCCHAGLPRSGKSQTEHGHLYIKCNVHTYQIQCTYFFIEMSSEAVISIRAISQGERRSSIYLVWKIPIFCEAMLLNLTLHSLATMSVPREGVYIHIYIYTYAYIIFGVALAGNIKLRKQAAKVRELVRELAPKYIPKLFV